MEKLGQCIYEGDAEGLLALLEHALATGASAREILERGLIAGMERVGREFQAGELFIPELIVAARAMHAGIDRIRPLLAAQQDLAPPRATIVLGTVKGDLHDIGKRLVGIMLEGAGYRVVDLGHDVAPERFLEAVRTERAALVGLSALLSTTMPMMRTTLTLLRDDAATRQVPVLVGGAPVTQAWADEIGADGYAPDAVSAVDKTRAIFAARASA